MKTLNYLSPRSLLVYAGALLFAFTLVPPGIYVRYMDEPNMMFGNIVLYLFLFCCLTVLRLGVYLASRAPAVRVPLLPSMLKVGPFSYLLAPVGVALGLLAATIALVLHNSPGILALALSGQGAEVKSAMTEASNGAFNGSLPLAMGVSWWALAKYLDSRAYISRMQRVLVSVLVALLVLALILAAALMMSRFVLMPTLCGLFVIYVRHKIVNDGIRVGWFILRTVIALALALILFGLFSVLRTGSDGHAMAQSFIGYGPASLNHLAALLEGRLDTKGLDQYLRQENFGFFYKFPFMTSLLGNADTFAEGFQSMFNRTWGSGLNGAYIWFTSFGEIAAQLNVLSIVYLLVYGYFVGRAWRGFVKATTFGMITYPWAAFGLLSSFGYNIIAKSFLSVLLLLALLLWAYSGLVRVKQKYRAM
ncbi:hypothetical protein [Rhodanobacter sp. MP7CTX1]|uniref:hypothetical protein n=1 Tax=Rhodanobacter sp. MP7CTX1 TaxID=2723084 RepID=UPI00160F4961|nr:hypothetical protein [Rhodanobacter sp. MP7CTX1]MBB6186541.1 hypothetical protein [Rhodanobacter sp. MP7CTX1]